MKKTLFLILMLLVSVSSFPVVLNKRGEKVVSKISVHNELDGDLCYIFEYDNQYNLRSFKCSISEDYYYLLYKSGGKLHCKIMERGVDSRYYHYGKGYHYEFDTDKDFNIITVRQINSGLDGGFLKGELTIKYTNEHPSGLPYVRKTYYKAYYKDDKNSAYKLCGTDNTAVATVWFVTYDENNNYHTSSVNVNGNNEKRYGKTTYPHCESYYTDWKNDTNVNFDMILYNKPSFLTWNLFFITEWCRLRSDNLISVMSSLNHNEFEFDDDGNLVRIKNIHCGAIETYDIEYL